MFARFVTYLWGDLNNQEFKKFGLLSLTFFFLIGAYWLLRTQKDAAFNAIVGLEFQPKAKMISFIVSVVAVLIYSKLVDMFDKNTLLISLSALFGGGFLTSAVLLAHPTIGFPNTVASPERYFGWFLYLFIESFGTVMVGLFWAFVTSSTKTESAKKGYPLIIAGSQIGSILGSWLSYKSKLFGNQLLFTVGALAICFIVPVVLFYLWSVPVEYRTGNPEAAGAKKAKTGMFEGLWLLMTRPYVLGIFGLATLYEVIGTILDFQMKMLARSAYPTKEAFASFNGLYGIFTNGLALVFALVGTSFLMRRYGLRWCLLLFPVATGIMIGAVYIQPTLWVVAGALIIIKGLSYALNNPAKEMMYLPTTKDVRFKAKGWIDMFGSRSSKATGAMVTDFFSNSMTNLLAYGTLISFGLVGVWVLVAMFVGTTFKHLTEKNQVID
jgi:AAA family ATP:ADP antiporter